MNYEELVKALRCKRDDCEGCDLAFLDNDEGWMCQYAAKDDDAADAIEALQAEVERLKDCNEELREKQTFIDHYGTEWMTSAKDVPTAAYKHGYADGMAEVKAQLPKRGEWKTTDAFPHRVYCSKCFRTYVPNDRWQIWVDNELPRNYCPNCGAKMEVQE